MKLPRNARQLEALFREAAAPLPHEFQGEYAVDMLTGLPSLKWAGHRKRFFELGGRPSGHNVLLGGWVWGRFALGASACWDMDGLPAVLIDYGRAGNSSVSRPMRDYVRRIEPGRYLGRLYYSVRGRLWFLGFFSLEKKENKAI